MEEVELSSELGAGATALSTSGVAHVLVVHHKWQGHCDLGKVTPQLHEVSSRAQGGSSCGSDCRCLTPG